jgi:ParB-like chromosome segregation protein Spo0J
MSDTTTLIHDYEVSRQLAERMNRASFAMKRSQRHNRLPIPELDEARKSAAETLAQVLQLLQPARRTLLRRCRLQKFPRN